MAALVLEQRRALAGVWAFRARSEREAEVRFGRLARQLAEHGARPPVVRMASRAAADEARHVEICAQLAQAYGGRARPGEPVAAEIGAPGLSGAARLLYEVVAFCCITESLNAALMTVSYQRAREPAVRAALRRILADEISHSRLGWAHLAAERAAGRGGFLAAHLPRMLAGAVAEELFSPAAGPPSAALLAHGELPEAARLELLLATLRDVVYPGLEAHGVGTAAARAWVDGLRSVRGAAG